MPEQLNYTLTESELSQVGLRLSSTQTGPELQQDARMHEQVPMVDELKKQPGKGLIGSSLWMKPPSASGSHRGAVDGAFIALGPAWPSV